MTSKKKYLQLLVHKKFQYSLAEKYYFSQVSPMNMDNILHVIINIFSVNIF